MLGLARHAEGLGEIAARDRHDVEPGTERISSSASTLSADSISTTFRMAVAASPRGSVAHGLHGGLGLGAGGDLREHHAEGAESSTGLTSSGRAPGTRTIGVAGVPLVAAIMAASDSMPTGACSVSSISQSTPVRASACTSCTLGIVTRQPSVARPSASARRSGLIESSALTCRAILGEAPPADEKGPDARRRPRAGREAYSLYVERPAAGANEADGPFSSACYRPPVTARVCPVM
jgi:hypothetical protein